MKWILIIAGVLFIGLVIAPLTYRDVKIEEIKSETETTKECFEQCKEIGYWGLGETRDEVCFDECKLADMIKQLKGRNAENNI